MLSSKNEVTTFLVLNLIQEWSWGTGYSKNNNVAVYAKVSPSGDVNANIKERYGIYLARKISITICTPSSRAIAAKQSVLNHAVSAFAGKAA